MNNKIEYEAPQVTEYGSIRARTGGADASALGDGVAFRGPADTTEPPVS